MQLVDLARLGAIGASLAFLLLSYRLLASATKAKVTKPTVLREIRRFRSSALLFLIVGVFSEFFLSHGVEITTALSQLLLKDELIRVRVNDWEYDPATRALGFSLEENRIERKAYVLPKLRDQYDIYVGVRKHETEAFDHGQYRLMIGPYHLATQPHIVKQLTADEVTLLGKACVEFTVFAITKENGNTVTMTRTFDPSTFGHGATVFHSSVVCPSDGPNELK
jgi:hypothetical protein